MTKRKSGKASSADSSKEAATPAQEHSPRQAKSIGTSRKKPQKMVRVSVDLPRTDHKYLRDFAYDAESNGMSVMRALLEEMKDDPELADRVQDRLTGE